MNEIVISLIGLLGVILGGGTFVFYKQNKKLKEAEAASMEKDVLAKDLANKQTANEEWITLYDEQKEYSKRLEVKLDNVNEENKELKKLLNDYRELDTKQRLLITNLNWARCEVNECAKRRPPRDFQNLFNEAESMHDELNDQDTKVGSEYHYDINTPIDVTAINANANIE